MRFWARLISSQRKLLTGLSLRTQIETKSQNLKTQSFYRFSFEPKYIPLWIKYSTKKNIAWWIYNTLFFRITTKASLNKRTFSKRWSKIYVRESKENISREREREVLYEESLLWMWKCEGITSIYTLEGAKKKLCLI